MYASQVRAQTTPTVGQSSTWHAHVQEHDFSERMKLPLTFACYGVLADAAGGRWTRSGIAASRAGTQMDERKATDHGTDGIRKTRYLGTTSDSRCTDLSVLAH